MAFKHKDSISFQRLALSKREQVNTITEQTGIWSRFRTAVMPSSSSQQSNL